MIREKCEKSPKFELFQKNDVHFAISKFSKFFKNYFFYNIKAKLEVSLGKKIQKKWKCMKREKCEKSPKFGTFSKKGPKFCNILVFGTL